MKLIEHYRNNQNKFRGEFVSVMDLVNYLATEDHVSTGDAAAALLSLFEKSEASDRPRYGSADEIDNSFVEMEKIQGVEHLDDVLDVSVGMKPGRFADVAGHFGWIREELFDFFKSKEIDPPIRLPDWKGSYGYVDCIESGGDHKSEYPTPPPMSDTNDAAHSAIDKPKFTNIVRAEQVQNIESETFNRLMRAIHAFPVKYPDYESDRPKLNLDVRPWLNEVGLVNDGALGREASVFGRIIAEHFKL